MDAMFLVVLMSLTVATGLVCWRQNPLLRQRAALRLGLLSGIAVATLTALATYLVALTVDRSAMTLVLTGGEAGIFGIAAILSLRLRLAQQAAHVNGEATQAGIL